MGVTGTPFRYDTKAQRTIQLQSVGSIPRIGLLAAIRWDSDPRADGFSNQVGAFLDILSRYAARITIMVSASMGLRYDGSGVQVRSRVQRLSRCLSWTLHHRQEARGPHLGQHNGFGGERHKSKKLLGVRTVWWRYRFWSQNLRIQILADLSRFEALLSHEKINDPTPSWERGPFLRLSYTNLYPSKWCNFHVFSYLIGQT